MCLFFMHLRWDRPINTLVLIGSIFFVVLFLIITMFDTGQSVELKDRWRFARRRDHARIAIVAGCRLNTLPEGRPVFESDRAAGAAVRMGMWLFVAGLAIIFVSTAIAHVAIRWQLGEQGSWPPDMPGPPGILGFSTILLLISSVTMWKATQRTDRKEDGRAWIGATLALGLAYAVTQTVAWLDWSPQVADAIEPFPEARLALRVYVLTGARAACFGGCSRWAGC